MSGLTGNAPFIDEVPPGESEVFEIADSGLVPDDEPLGERIPLILIHGWCGNQETWKSFSTYFNQDGVLARKFKLYYFTYATGFAGFPPPPFTCGDDNTNHTKARVIGLAQELKTQIDQRMWVNEKLVFITHSLGGLIARSLMQEFGGHHQTLKLITLATPHHGTLIANDLDADESLSSLYWDNYSGDSEPTTDWLRCLNGLQESGCNESEVGKREDDRVGTLSKAVVIGTIRDSNANHDSVVPIDSALFLGTSDPDHAASKAAKLILRRYGGVDCPDGVFEAEHQAIHESDCVVNEWKPAEGTLPVYPLNPSLTTGLTRVFDVIRSELLAFNQSPDGTIDSPAGDITIVAGTSVAFLGTGTDPDNDVPLSYSWNFGGGAPNSTAEDPGLVTFNTPGVYTVTFTVTDSLGFSDPTPATRQITVNPPPPPPPSTGTIEVRATLDGSPWSGPITYNLTGPSNFSGSAVPGTLSDKPTGSYTMSFLSGGPAGATHSGISPAGTQVLNSGSTVTFTLNFTALCKLGVGPLTLNFGDVQVGTTADGVFAVQNQVDGPTVTVNVSTTSPFSITSATSFTVGPGEGPLVSVRFSPTSAGQVSVPINVTAPNCSFVVTATGNGTSGPSPGGTVLTVGSLNPSIGVVIAVSPFDNNGQGDGTTPFTRSYNKDTIVTVTAPETVGSTPFWKWQLDGFDFTDGRTTSLSVDANHTMTAVYQSHTLTITSPASGNPNPVSSGGTANLSVAAVDSLGHSLSFSWTSSCPTLGSNGSFSNVALQNPTWTAPTNTTSTRQKCTIEVTVSDGQGLSRVSSYNQGVEKLPHNFTFTSNANGSPNPVVSGGTVNVSAAAEDSLGHPVTYSWVADCSSLGANGSFADPSLPNTTWTAPENTTGQDWPCAIKVTASSDIGDLTSRYDEIIETPFPDTIAPAAVGDLLTGPVTAFSVALSWTVPGDDGTTGTATRYDIRYTTSPISEANWNASIIAIGKPAPLPAGSSQSFVVKGLSCDTTYYFALKTGDDVGNTSAISNQAVATTAACPVNPPSTKIAFGSLRDGNGEIYLMDPNGANQVNLTNDPAADGDPSWSPDGKQIAFTSNRSGTNQIWVMDADGSNPTQITNDPGGASAPAWSPDGTRIAYVSGDGSGAEIYMTDAGGTNPTPLTSNTWSDYDPSWSPDGTKILFRSRNRDNKCCSLWVVNADGTNPKPVKPENDGDDGGASWSPDGTMIAFHNPEGDIFVINADGSDPVMLTREARGGNVDPSWSPDGTKITFGSRRDGNDEIYVMNADGTNRTRLTNNPAVDQTPAWSPLPPDSTPPVPGPVNASNSGVGSFVDSPFDLTASFTDSESAVTSCEYTTDGGITWDTATLSGSGSDFTCSKTGITGSDGQVLSLNMRATNKGGTGTATAVTRTVDAAAPTTTDNAPAGWVGTDQTVTLTPGDASGSGVASTQYCTDAANSCTPSISGTLVSVTCGVGSVCQTFVRYLSTDNVGNVEAIKSALVKISKVFPSLSINDVPVNPEGNSGTANAVFTVSLSAPSAQVVTVKYATANGTAKAGSDYVANSGTLTFNPGDTSKPVTIAVKGDTLDEANETFYVNLSTPINATIADSKGVGTIIDDDPPPTISISDATKTEGNTGTANAVFKVSLSAPSGLTVKVKYATANGTATAGSDYKAKSGTLSFSPGQTSKNITIAVIGDTVPEPTQTFFVNLSNATNANIADNQGVGTIIDND